MNIIIFHVNKYQFATTELQNDNLDYVKITKRHYKKSHLQSLSSANEIFIIYISRLDFGFQIKYPQYADQHRATQAK